MIKKQYSKTKPVCKVTFSVSAEDFGKNADVRVLGQFNDWNLDDAIKLKKSKEQYNASVELAAGNSYEFRYLVNGDTWMNDTAADGYVATPYYSENSVVVLDEVKIAAKPAKKAAPKAKAVKAKPVVKKAAPKAKAVKAKPVTKKAAPKAKVVKAKPVAKKAIADNLTKIEGIGPKIADLLKVDGIATFAELSKAKVSQLKAVLEGAGNRYKMHDPTTWPKQAKLAADGEWAKLETLQDKLKGGRK